MNTHTTRKPTNAASSQIHAYAATSNRIGSAFIRTETARRIYRGAAERRHATHETLCKLHAQGADTRRARELADKAERAFWAADHYFRRYVAFYK